MKYLRIDLYKGSSAQFRFDNINYRLSQDEVTRLVETGILRKVDSDIIPQTENYGFRTSDSGYACHRCREPLRNATPPTACPHCYSNTWNTYTLLYCCECHALFEYYWHLLDESHPYDRFPRCPACKSERWCPAENERVKGLPAKEEMQAQAEAKRQKEAEAFTQLMELRKQQQLKKLGLRQPSPQVEEKGAAIPEAEAYYTSAERKTPWLDKGARPVELPDIQPRHSTPVHKPPTSMSQRPTPALQQPTVAPRRGIFSILRDWFRPRRP